MTEEHTDETEDVRIVTPPNLLKTKAGDGPAKLDPETARILDEAIREEAKGYPKILDAQIHKMQKICMPFLKGNRMPEAEVGSIFYIAHQIRGEAGIGGLMLVETISNLLCDVLEESDAFSDKLVELVTLHINALAAVRSAELSGEGGNTGEKIVDGLKKARMKFLS